MATRTSSRSRSQLRRLTEAFAGLVINARQTRIQNSISSDRMEEEDSTQTTKASWQPDTQYYDKHWWFDNRWWEWQQEGWWTKWIEYKDTGNTFTWIPWHQWRSWSK